MSLRSLDFFLGIRLPPETFFVTGEIALSLEVISIVDQGIYELTQKKAFQNLKDSVQDKQTASSASWSEEEDEEGRENHVAYVYVARGRRERIASDKKTKIVQSVWKTWSFFSVLKKGDGMKKSEKLCFSEGGLLSRKNLLSH